MLEQTVQIISNERDTDLYFRLVVRAPQIAPLVAPGQFAHLRILPMKEALLRRPFSIYQVAGETLSILYKAVGKGTEALSRMRPGEELSALGPLGHGFTVPPPGGETPMLVAGGYGMAAMYLLAQRSPQKGIVFVGGRRRVDILCELEFRALGWDVRVTTEDGSHGGKGLVTHPLIAELRRTVIWPSPPSKPPSSLGELTERGVGVGRGPQNDARRKIFACGPTPMLNAFEALTSGGSLTVTTSYAPETATLAVMIEDTGSGMTEEVLARAFDPFFTTKAEGTGLGMSIARSVVDLHGGTLTVQSRVGNGTRVQIKLPVQP